MESWFCLGVGGLEGQGLAMLWAAWRGSFSPLLGGAQLLPGTFCCCCWLGQSGALVYWLGAPRGAGEGVLRLSCSLFGPGGCWLWKGKGEQGAAALGRGYKVLGLAVVLFPLSQVRVGHTGRGLSDCEGSCPDFGGGGGKVLGWSLVAAANGWLRFHQLRSWRPGEGHIVC